MKKINFLKFLSTIVGTFLIFYACCSDRTIFIPNEITPIVGGTATASGVPTNVTADAPPDSQDTEITVTWVAPLDPGSDALGNKSTVTAYEAQYKIKGANSWTDWDNGGRGISASTNKILITDLSPDTKYEFQVRAVNALLLKGEYGVTVATLQTAVAPVAKGSATPPGVPQNLNASDQQANSIRINWTAPADNGLNADGSASSITSYQVQYQMAGSNSWSTWDNGGIAITGLSTLVTGLISNTAYNFRIRAINRENLKSNYAQMANPVSTPSTNIANGSATPPGAPQSMAVSNQGPNSITMTWTAPTDNGLNADGTASTIEKYELEYQVEHAVNWANWDNGGSDIKTMSVTVTGLTPNTIYNFRVRAVNTANLAGEFIQTSTITAPENNTGGTGNTGGTTGTGGTGNTGGTTGTGGTGNTGGTTGTGGTGNTGGTTGTGGTGNTGGTTGTGGTNNQPINPRAPSSPTNVQVSRSGNDLIISWSPPNDPGTLTDGTPTSINNYLISFVSSDGSGGTVSPNPSAGNDATFTPNGIPATGTLYSFQVTAQSNAPDNNFSSSSTGAYRY